MRGPENIGELFLLADAGKLELKLRKALPLDPWREGTCRIGNGVLKQSVVLDDEWEQPRREVTLGGDDGDVSGADSVEWGDGRLT